MIVEINANETEIRSIINLLETTSSLNNIADQLKKSLVQTDDTQLGEIPEEGDNALIKRME